MSSAAPGFPYERLRRWPDVEAPNLFAADAADRLIADLAGDAVLAPGLVVIGDAYGALTLAAAARGARGIRVHQDPLTGERALDANAAALDPATADTDATTPTSTTPTPTTAPPTTAPPTTATSDSAPTYTHHPLDPSLVRNAHTVLLRLPRSLDALAEIAALIAEHARPDVTVYAGGMLKHMTTAMNAVLGEVFGSVEASLARQKARVLIAREPHPAAATVLDRWPERARDAETGLWVCAHGAAFAGTSIDMGTRFLLGVLDRAVPEARTAVDLGCGTGVLASALAVARPHLRVTATDQSAAAVASAHATAAANGVADRVTVVRDDGLASQPDSSADLIVLNPPFHIGSAVHTGIAHRLFAHAGRVLAPGGELWTVWNSHLGYRPALEQTVGPTRRIARNPKFTITASRKRTN